MASGDTSLLALLREIQAENTADHQEIKEALRQMNGRLRQAEIGLARVEGLDNRVQQTEVELARVKERQNVMTALASSIGVIASAIAAWLGMRQ